MPDRVDRNAKGETSEAGAASARKSYVAPTLVRLGRLDDLTLGGAGTKADTGPFKTKP